MMCADSSPAEVGRRAGGRGVLPAERQRGLAAQVPRDAARQRHVGTRRVRQGKRLDNHLRYNRGFI